MEEKVKPVRRKFQYQCKEDVAAVKWMDNKPVIILITTNNPKCTTTVSRKNKDGSICQISCPTSVATYYEIMGGVHHFVINFENVMRLDGLVVSDFLLPH
ncbi:hypothetical protein TNIN_191821 [Trichonephila inaurata madagascariensis]|uniref:PiggyBac transposable element-derived protein domain-containing protein n=1 Tax=Trichonephila inaurata madagascariensis TaxID=2747483 RepID=A0A8X6JCV7_9ARAC|nr:hypothetical protein TNIN_191821 [Trichonephila inaurata madagascariensis]